jgi:hypothetical protein
MAIRDIRLWDGSQLKLDEWVHFPSFSTMEIAAASSPDLRVFNYVTGNTVTSNLAVKRAATDADTNWTTKSRTNFDEAFVVYGVTYEIFGLTDATERTVGQGSPAPAPMVTRQNVMRLQRDCTLELFYGAGQSKPQLRQTFSRIPQSVGAVAHGTSFGVVVNTAVVRDIGTGGAVSPKNQWLLALPIFMESDRNFYLRFKSYRAIADLDQDIRLRFYLDGMKRRPVA